MSPFWSLLGFIHSVRVGLLLMTLKRCKGVHTTPITSSLYLPLLPPHQALHRHDRVHQVLNWGWTMELRSTVRPWNYTLATITCVSEKFPASTMSFWRRTTHKRPRGSKLLAFHTLYYDDGFLISADLLSNIFPQRVMFSSLFQLFTDTTFASSGSFSFRYGVILNMHLT